MNDLEVVGPLSPALWLFVLECALKEAAGVLVLWPGLKNQTVPHGDELSLTPHLGCDIYVCVYMNVEKTQTDGSCLPKTR